MDITTTSDDLLPCPFCGCAAKLYGHGEDLAAAINCTVCDAYGPSVQGCAAAITAWNRRAAMQTAEPCTDPDACNAQGCRNPLGRCEDAAPDRAPSTDSAAGWISVDERLPDVPFFIVRSTRHDEDSIDGIEQFEGIWAVRPVASATEETLRRWIARHEVTHWMPLPATPGATMHPEGGNDA